MGAVVDVVKRILPSSYRAMIAVSNTYYSMTELQGLADAVKFKLFSTSVDVAAEVSTYDIRTIDLLGKLTALQFIPAAIDYWGDQLTHERTFGTHEMVVYPDRRAGLEKIFNELQAQAREEYELMLGTVLPGVSYGDNGRGIMVTPDPALFRKPYIRDRRDDFGLVWSG